MKFIFRAGLVVGWLLCVHGAAGSAWADIFALTTPQQRFRIVQFSGQGQFVGTFPVPGESSEGIDAGPDGWVYLATNTLGTGFLHRFRADRPGTTEQVTFPRDLQSEPYNIPFGLTVASDGMVYATSNRFTTNGISGIMRYDPSDRTFVPVVILPESQPFSDLIFSVAVSAGGDVFLTRSVGVERYAGDTGQFIQLMVDRSSVAGLGDVEFGPDGNLYVRTSQGIDRYNPETGALIDHFVPNGTGGLNGAKDFVFSTDGFLYVNSADSILRFDATTGAFRDVFVTPNQYALAGPGGVREITYVVPEPNAVGIAVLAAPLLARRVRRRAKSASRQRLPTPARRGTAGE